jgi:uncharacterized protein with PIN domain
MQRATSALGTALKVLAVGLVVRKLTSMVKQQLQAVDAAAKLSRQLGGTIDGLQGLQLAASEAGVNTGTLTSSMERLNVKLGEAARKGSGPAHEALQRLGLDARELSAMDLDVRMAAIAEAFAETGMSAQATAETLAQMGIRQGEFTRLMLDGGTAIREARAAIDEMGLSLTEIEASKIEAANDAMERVKMASTAIARRLAVDLSPLLTTISNQFLDVAQDTDTLREGVRACGLGNGHGFHGGFSRHQRRDYFRGRYHHCWPHQFFD